VALQNSRFDFPTRRVTVNMAPVDLPKDAARFDLPIAIGILAASGQIPAQVLEKFEFVGELTLSGELRPVLGALAMIAAIAKRARERQPRGFILPVDNADEAALVGGVAVYPAKSLRQVVSHLEFVAGNAKGAQIPEHFAQVRLSPPAYPDYFDVKGQESAKRALEIAAVGGHSVLIVGPPSTGKTMLAERFPGLLPPMEIEEALESAAVLSLVGKFAPQRWATRVFRAPHHSISAAGLLGGGAYSAPGEISLAHNGVLFLDELPEMDRRVLELLREPLETGRITVARAARQLDYPAHFHLLAAMNPCPCGYHSHPAIACRCTPEMVSRYQDRISGPVLERIDLRVEVAALSTEEIANLPDGELSRYMAERVARARKLALQRQGKINDELSSSEIERICRPEGAVRQLLHAASSRLGWSARAYHRVLKVARSIADLEGTEALDSQHVAEAIHYRRSLRET
ncbi:MAG TPA: YifB family Mg chelatase-like AAA ATPase, partial [Burkholderiaceae bacterium]|nr:YifB family Mg chelatase-like AAA ATPase [Burkholderiaceae bacterium]